MNTAQLERYMLNDVFIRQYYGGVLAADQLPLVVRKPTIYIVNTDPIALKGEHWLVLFMDNDLCEHFDSAGFPPRQDFEVYLTAKGPDYLYNTERVQHVDSNTCGLFCLFYAYFRCRGFSMLEIMSMFSENLLINEVLVKTFYFETV